MSLLGIAPRAAAEPSAAPSASASASPSANPSNESTAEPEQSASAEPSQAAKTGESASPTPGESASPAPSESSSPAPSESATPDPSESASPDPSKSATPSEKATTPPAPKRAARAAAKVVDDVIVPGSIKITNVTHPDGPNHIYDQMRVDFDIDTAGKNVAAGDTFSLTYPTDTLKPRAGNFQIVNKAGLPVADCSISGGTMLCTFTDYVTTHPALKGSGFMMADTRKAQTVDTVTLETDDGTVTVSLPNGGIVPSEPATVTETKKEGYLSTDDATVLNWRLLIPIAADSTVRTLTIEDHLGERQTLRSDFTVSVYAPGVYPVGAPEETITPGDPSLTFTPNTDNTEFTATVTGVRPDRLYTVTYSVTLDDPQIGDKFTNEATVNGVGYSSTVEKFTVGGGSVDGPGFGGLSIRKGIEGESAGAVPLDTTFIVRAEYEVDGEPKVTDLTLTADGAEQSLHHLPAGTRVTLTELTPPPVAGVSWCGARFATRIETRQAARATGTVIIEDQGTMQLEIVNEACTATPKIDIEKWSSDGAPTYDADGNVTNDHAPGDHDAAPGLELDPKAPEQITFTVSNNGTEPLTDVVVNDETRDGAKVEGLVCTFPDKTTGMTWAGPLAVGARFTCTGTLPALGDAATHSDEATVTAVGAASKKPVDDRDLWYGHTPDQTPSPTPSENPAASVPPPQNPAASTPPPQNPAASTPLPQNPAAVGGPLADTGSSSGIGTAALLGGLLLASGLGLVLRRRR